MSFNCQYCSNTYNSKYHLARHQTTESCVKIQKTINDCNTKLKENELQCNNRVKLLEEKVYELTQENEYLKCELESLKELKENTNETDSESELHLPKKSSESLETTVVINNNSFNLFSNLTCKNLVLNNIEIIYRKEDGYIDATKLCQAGDKRYNNWYQNDKTRRFLDVLSSTTGIPAFQLLKQEQGGNGERHTWAHPQVAINIAQWISPEFDVQVSKWVYELCITGNVSLDTKTTTQELDNMLKEKYEKQLQEMNRLQEIENKYKYELDILKTKENELKEELEQYKHQNMKYTNNIQSCKDKERELLIILENTQNKLLSVKENYENEINNKPLDKYVNEICDNFRLNDKIENYYGYNCLYVIYIDSINETDDKKQYYLKFGETSNVENRMIQHRQKFKNMKIMWIVKSNNANHTEKKLKEWLKTNNMLSKYENQTEIIKFDTEEQLFNIKDKICMLDRENNTINNEILKLNHNIELDNEKINGLQEKIKCLENQIKLYEHIIKITIK